MPSLVEISGVVVPGSVQPIEEHDESYSIAFSLKPWRDGDGKVHDKKLNGMWKKLAKSEVAARISELAPGSSRSFKVHLKELMPGFFHAEVIAPPSNAGGDSVLEAASASVRSELIIEDPLFGRLEKDPDLRCYRGRQGDLELRFFIESEPRKVSNAMRASALWVASNRDRLFEAVVSELLPLYNDTWRAGAPKRTREEFLKDVRLASASLYEDGSLSLYFEAGPLFAGHGIDLYVDANKGLRKPGLIG